MRNFVIEPDSINKTIQKLLAKKELWQIADQLETPVPVTSGLDFRNHTSSLAENITERSQIRSNEKCKPKPSGPIVTAGFSFLNDNQRKLLPIQQNSEKLSPIQQRVKSALAEKEKHEGKSGGNSPT